MPPPSEFRVLEARFQDYYAWVLADETESREDKNELGAESAMLSLPTRWWHLVEHYLNLLSRGSSVSNPTLEMVKNRNAVINQKTTILKKFNGALDDRNLYKVFESESVLSGLDDDRKHAIEPLLKKAREINVSLAALETAESVMPADHLSTDSDMLRKSEKLTAEDHKRAGEDVNRALLRAYYSGTISPRDTVYSSVVLHADQAVRLRWFLIAGCVFLVLGTFVDLNATSWHAFYSRQMANMWIEPVSGGGEDGREIACHGFRPSNPAGHTI